MQPRVTITSPYRGLGNGKQQCNVEVMELLELPGLLRQPSPEMAPMADQASALHMGYIFKEMTYSMAAGGKYTPALCKEAGFQLLRPLQRLHFLCSL